MAWKPRWKDGVQRTHPTHTEAGACGTTPAQSVPARTLARGLASGLLLVAACGGSLAAQRTLDAVLRDTVLDNGLHVIAVPSAMVPLATIQVTVRNGAFTQLVPADGGVPHLLEHMLFKDGFSEQASKIDADWNGTTDDETVTYYITLPASNLGRGMQLMADLVRSPRFTNALLEPEKRVVRGELERLAADPAFVFRTMVGQRLWGDGWERKNAIGNALAIGAATPALLQQTYNRFYVPNNAAVVVAGDIDPAQVFALAGRHFSRWRRGSDPFEGLDLPPMPPLRSHQQVTVIQETNDVTLSVSWHGPSVRDDVRGAYAADVFAAIVNDRISGMQSRLVDSGLFQSLSMSYLTRAHVGPITIRGTTTADQLVDASAALRAELELFLEPDYVTPEALQIARKRQEVDWAMELDTPSGLPWLVGDLWSVSGGLDFVRGYGRAMQDVEEQDLEAYVATYLAGRPRVFAIMISAATRQELGSRLQTALAHWRR